MAAGNRMQTVQRTIGGSTFSVTPLPAMRSFVLQPRVAPVIAEVLAAMTKLLSVAKPPKAAAAPAAEQEEGEAPPAAAGGLDGLLDLRLEDVVGLVDELVPVVARVCAKLPSAELEGIVRELLASTRMDGKPLFTAEGNPFDVLMAGRTVDTWRLLLFAIEVNYPDFFALRGGKGAPSATPSPSAASTT
jgi:hypothetical protein